MPWMQVKEVALGKGGGRCIAVLFCPVVAGSVARTTTRAWATYELRQSKEMSK